MRASRLLMSLAEIFAHLTKPVAATTPAKYVAKGMARKWTMHEQRQAELAAKSKVPLAESALESREELRQHKPSKREQLALANERRWAAWRAWKEAVQVKQITKLAPQNPNQKIPP